MNKRTVAGYFVETGFLFVSPGAEASSCSPIMLQVSKRRFDELVKRLNEFGIKYEIRNVHGSTASVEICLYYRGEGSRMAPRDHAPSVTV